MKKFTKTMMVAGMLGIASGMATYMYKQKNKKIIEKYKAYLEN